MSISEDRVMTEEDSPPSDIVPIERQEDTIVHNNDEENDQSAANMDTQVDTSDPAGTNNDTLAGKASHVPQLPLARVKNIMKYDPEVALIGSDTVYLVTKSAELFIAKLAESAHQFTVQGKRKTVQRRDMDQCVSLYDHFSFLEGILDSKTL